MFPTPTTRRPNKRSLRELVRSAVDTAVEFATLAEPMREPQPRRVPLTAVAHPHRRPLGRRDRTRRPGMGSARPQVCTSPVAPRTAVEPAG